VPTLALNYGEPARVERSSIYTRANSTSSCPVFTACAKDIETTAPTAIDFATVNSGLRTQCNRIRKP
jgi:hypothetical protein